MSGAYVAYHQRQNKAVDRHLFIDLLGRLNRALPISDFTYVSFGGAFLEDFKLIHSAFGNHDLVSLESDKVAWKRQKFNVPLNCIECKHQTSSDFIDSYAIDGNAIVWLDYTEPKKLQDQFAEFQTLLAKLKRHDVLKITLNANPDALLSSRRSDETGKPETIDELNGKRFAVLQKRIDEFIPHDVTSASMTVDELPIVLCRSLENAANEAMKSRPSLIFKPLSTFAYSDSYHQMLTVTGILLLKKERKDFLKVTGLKAFKMATRSWKKVARIMLPALTARERLFIDQLLPLFGEREIQKQLNFLFDKKRPRSLRILKNYIQFYRQYPNFHRVHF